MLRVVTRLVADTVLVGVVLFAAAGTPTWGRGWVLLAVLLFVRTTGAVAAYRVNPDLLLERAELPVHTAQPWSDRLLLVAILATGFLGLPVVAALDVFRWRLLPPPQWAIAGLGLVLFAAGWGLKSVALRANPFATAALRMQPERGHTVVDSGVYGALRHPFYAADPLILIGQALWLGSYPAALVAVLPLMLLVIRIRLEERLLQRELPGYHEYTLRVRYRLIPGIW